MTKLSKNYRAAIEKIGEEAYAPLAAMNLVKEVSTAKFDETVTVDFRLGIVTNDVAKAINELKGGRVEYRADRYGIAHVIIGKVSFTAEQLAENYGAVYDEIIRMKPAAAKGKYVKSVTVSATMTPGVSVDSSVTRNYTEAGE